MQLNRLVLSWQGPSIVGQAVTVLHFAGDAGAVPVAAVKTAVDKLIPALPTTVTVTTPATGEVIEDTTGMLTGVWSGSGGGNTVGAGGTNAAAGVGACISWSTGGIINGRRLRGRTFVVPLHAGCYDTDGTLVPGTLINLTDFANGLMAAGPLAIWHRPTTKGGSDGNSYGVTGARVRDRVAVLRSRRY